MKVAAGIRGGSAQGRNKLAGLLIGKRRNKCPGKKRKGTGCKPTASSEDKG